MWCERPLHRVPAFQERYRCGHFSTRGEQEAWLKWRDVQEPGIEQSTDAIVRPLAIAACDLDRAITRGASSFPGPFMLGHEFTGEVISVGEAVTGVRPGDRVLASFQPSCGHCTPCGRRLSSTCQEVTNGAMYGIGAAGGNWAGAIADAIRVPWADANLLCLGEDINLNAVASASDNFADALRCVEEPLARHAGASVLIAGSGSIPLYAIVWAQHLGASQITLASKDRFCLEVGDRLGAECLEVGEWPSRFRNHDVTVDATNDVAGLAAVLRSTGAYGECTSASIYFGLETVPVPMFNLNMKGVHFHTGRVNSASLMGHVIDQVRLGADPDRIEPVYCGHGGCH